MKEARGIGDGTGDAPVLPSSRDAERCMHRASAYQWWRMVPTLAGLEPTLARLALAQAEVHQQPDGPAVRVFCELGDWRDAQTLLRCYQRPHAGQGRTAVEGRRRSRG